LKGQSHLLHKFAAQSDLLFTSLSSQIAWWWWWWLGNTGGNGITLAVLIFLHSCLKDVKCDPLYRAHPHGIFRHVLKKPLYRVLIKTLLQGEHGNNVNFFDIQMTVHRDTFL